jgi:hypothetical protein
MSHIIVVTEAERGARRPDLHHRGRVRQIVRGVVGVPERVAPPPEERRLGRRVEHEARPRTASVPPRRYVVRGQPEHLRRAPRVRGLQLRRRAEPCGHLRRHRQLGRLLVAQPVVPRCRRVWGSRVRHAVVRAEGDAFRVICPCGTPMSHTESAPQRAVAQADRLEEYIERTGECHHERHAREFPESGGAGR